MAALSLAWAMSGQAIDAVGDTHLAEGMHYRVLINPLLGLPVAPLAISKINLAGNAKGLTRRDVVWVDSHQVQRTVPFTVTPDNPVTAHIPPGQICCWAAVDAVPASQGVLPSRPPRSGPVFDVVGPGPRFDVLKPRAAGLSVTALVNSGQGDAPVAVKSVAPYHVYASHIARVQVRGSGTVRGIDWLPAAAVDHFEPLGTMGLPIGPGPRYVGPVDGLDLGYARVKDGAPQRLGMHESPTVAAPIGCAGVTPSDEYLRIEQVHASLVGFLDAAVNDTSAPVWDLTIDEVLLNDVGTTLGTAQHYPLWDLLQACVDPGYARLMGLLDVDTTSNQRGSVVAYVVQGLFEPDWKGIERRRLTKLFTASGAVFDDMSKAMSALVESAPQMEEHLDTIQGVGGKGPFLLQRVVLAATQGNPLDVPAAPAVSPPVAGDWLPTNPPRAAREVTVSLERLVPAAGLASAIGQPSGAPEEQRNPVDGSGRGRLLTPQADQVVPTPTSGRLSDRRVDEQTGTWKVAQIDWFGRWSRWAQLTIPAGTRPRPPRPVFTLTTIGPVLPPPPSTAPVAGRVRVEVAVPPPDGLPAGARLLKHLELTVDRGAGPAVSIHPLPSPANPAETLMILVDGPLLGPTAIGTVVLSAIWVDSANVASDASDKKSTTFHDPRPPAPVTMDPTLTYTSRPDSTGRARTTLTWSATTSQPFFRVFVSDETILRSKLQDIAAGNPAAGDTPSGGSGQPGEAPTPAQAQALLTALDAVPDAPARGEVWNTNRHRLPRRWWLQLTGEPLPRPASGQLQFTHDVSGSLDVLVLYRVVAVGAASVESDFRTSALLPRKVPNLLVPQVPRLAVELVMAGSDLQARLTVTVPSGSVAAARYRIRRATATTDAAMMPIIAEGSLSVPANPADAQTAQFLDTGATLEGPRTSLNPWLLYNWRVEVRAGAAPGGGPVGEWSTASEPVSLTTMPASPPAAVTDVSAIRSGTDVILRFKHPEPLSPGASTGYTLDVYRQLPAGQLLPWTSIPGQMPPRVDDPWSFYSVVDDSAPPAKTLYRVVVTDPIGRASPVSAPVEAP